MHYPPPNTQILTHSCCCPPSLQICWHNRWMQYNGSRCLITLDGTDFRIQEQHPFSSKWFTKKFKGPGLRYEVGVCIQTGWIVWINGPFPCGEWPDLNIAMASVVHMLEGDERIVADSGYHGHPEYFDTPRGAARHLPGPGMRQSTGVSSSGRCSRSAGGTTLECME